MKRWSSLLFYLSLLFSIAENTSATDTIVFETDVRPILKAHCFHCHGEAGEKEGGLDLRLRRLIVTGGDSGPALVVGAPEASMLLQRIETGEMPPGDDKHLGKAELDILSKWIKEGAQTAGPEPEEIGDGPLFTQQEMNYWAFQPVRRPAVPEIQDSRIRNPIDAFLLAKDSERHPGFAPDADHAMLLRRAAFDLIGLPPSPELLDSSEKNSTDWWDTVIEKLLNSQHYGERWGRHWLDVAGYADSEGYTDEDRVRNNAWRYRDYVIRSLNADKPFDLFIQEQLAGDEMVSLPYKNLSDDQIEKLTATGFLRMAPDGTASGGINQTEARNQVIADTMQIIGSSLLGLTVHCAQCHDHRYDPIPQADYYRLRAIFEPALDWKNWKSPPQRRISLYTDADHEVAKKLEAEAAEVDQQRLAKAEEYITRTLEEELQLVPEDFRDKLRSAYRTAGKDQTDEQKALLKEYPSVAKISTGSLYLYDRRRDERARKIDAERKQKEQQFVEETRKAELAKVPETDRLEVESALEAQVETRTNDQTELLKTYPGTQVTLATLSHFNPEAAAEIERDRKLADELRSSRAAEDLKSYSEKAAAIRAKKPEEGFVRAVFETPGTVPATYVFHRGDPEQPKDVVKPGELRILSQRPEITEDNPELPSTGRRLAFARQLTDGTHPLLARVIVNRIWLHHFGRGLIETPGDFGVLGAEPTHEKLLDWLASEFVDSGWSMKHMHRLIMNSSAYRQSSIATSDAREIDPENELYTRFPVRRLEAEVIRDAMLAVADKLNTKMFGPPVPVMEDAVGQIVLGKENLDGERKPTKKVDLGGEEFRRSIYVQVRRTRTLSLFETFDAPEMSPNCERRDASTVATQSLFFMNSDAVVEFSNHFADRLLADAPGDLRKQVTRAWQLAYTKTPTALDLSAACQFVESEQTLIKDQKIETDDNKIQQEALAVFCQALLSSNRFLYVE